MCKYCDNVMNKGIECIEWILDSDGEVQERKITPRFCPWCGERFENIHSLLESAKSLLINKAIHEGPLGTFSVVEKIEEIMREIK